MRLHVNRRESCITWQGLKGWFTQITHLPNLPLKLLLHNFYSGVEVVFFFYFFFFSRNIYSTQSWYHAVNNFSTGIFLQEEVPNKPVDSKDFGCSGVTWKYTMLLSSILWRAQHRQIKISHNLIMCPSGNYSIMLNMGEMSLFIYCFNIEIPVR